MGRKKKKDNDWIITLLFVFSIFFGIILMSLTASAKTIICTAGGYTRSIEAVSNFVDVNYVEASKIFKWHIELIDSPSMVNDYLIIKDEKYSMIYPADCKAEE